MRGAAASRLPLLLLLLMSPARGVHSLYSTPGAVRNEEVVEGGTAYLTCDASLPRQDDTLLVLVWYKNYQGQQVAIYSYDSRVPTSWCKDTFNTTGRVVSPTNTSLAPGSRLVITKTVSEDEALYHCRVDFQLSPTANSYVNLTVVVLPRTPFVKDETGAVINGTVPHHHEGHTLILTCYVIGGRPPPQLRWYSGETLLDASDSESDTPNMRENELFLTLTREYAAAPLQCEASNTDLAAPRVKAVQLELYVPATKMELQWESGAERDGSLLAGRRAVAHCRAAGAHPQPELSWWLDQTDLLNVTIAALSHELRERALWHFEQYWDSATLTADSYAEFTPTKSHHGKTLACVATNELLAPDNASTTRITTITVLYGPTVRLTKLSPSRVNETQEGSTLRLLCEVEANSPVHVARWHFNGSLITSPELSPLFSAVTMVGTELQFVARRHHAGRYACAAANQRGEARSQDLVISVLYPPECESSGVSLREDSLRCSLDGLPAPDTFLWRVRPGSGDLQKLTTATDTLRLSLLQGSLEKVEAWCEGVSSAGSQRTPCEASLSLTHLRPAPPTLCDMTFELDAFHVHCAPGGNATYHVLSVWRMSSSNSSLVLAWRARSAFGDGAMVGGAVGALGAGDEAGVAACNPFGCSADTLVRPTAALLQAAAPHWWRGIVYKELGVSLGIALIVGVCVVCSLLVTRLTRSRTKPPVIQVLQIDEFTARDYIETLERKSRSNRSECSVYSGGSLEEPSRKPLVWCRADSRDRLPDITTQLGTESAV